MKKKLTRKSTVSRTLALAVLAAASSCSGGGSGGDGGGGTTPGVGAGAGDFVIQDAPTASLLAFSATVSEVYLQSAGVPTANLLPAPVTVEFLGLQGTVGWLATLDTLPLGTYDSVRVVFQPMSYSARANDGTPVAVSASSNEMTLNLLTPVVVDGTGYNRFEIDLNLTDSLAGSVASPPRTSTPRAASRTTTAPS